MMSTPIPQILFSQKRFQFMNPDEVLGQLKLERGQRIADFGCGPGFFAIPAAKFVGDKGQILAVDIQLPVLEVLINKARREDISNIIPIRGDIEVLGGTEIKDASCDFVLISNVLFQSKKHKEILEEAKRVLKKGGKIVIIEWKKQASLGPLQDVRVSPLDLKKITEELGLKFDSEIKAGTYHYGLVFRK